MPPPACPSTAIAPIRPHRRRSAGNEPARSNGSRSVGERAETAQRSRSNSASWPPLWFSSGRRQAPSANQAGDVFGLRGEDRSIDRVNQSQRSRRLPRCCVSGEDREGSWRQRSPPRSRLPERSPRFHPGTFFSSSTMTCGKKNSLGFAQPT